MKKATLGQIRYMLDLLDEKNVPSARLQTLIDKGFLADLLDADPAKIGRQELRRLLRLEPLVFPRIRLFIDSEQSFKSMVDAGQYSHVSETINASDFPVKGNGRYEIDLELIHLNRDLDCGDIHHELTQRGRPARIEELLALGAVDADLPRGFPFVKYHDLTVFALVSSYLYQGNYPAYFMIFPFITLSHQGRTIGTRSESDSMSPGVKWSDSCIFAVVPE